MRRLIGGKVNACIFPAKAGGEWPRCGWHGQFERSPRGDHSVDPNCNRKMNLLLIRCRLHNRRFSMQLLIAPAPSAESLGL